MKKKIKISNIFPLPDEFLAISSQLKDYQLARELNAHLKIELSILRTEFISAFKENEEADIILYSYNSERGHYYLLKNYSGGICILPKLKNIDYLLIIEDKKTDLEKISKTISSFSSVMGVFKIKQDKHHIDLLRKILMK